MPSLCKIIRGNVPDGTGKVFLALRHDFPDLTARPAEEEGDCAGAGGGGNGREILERARLEAEETIIRARIEAEEVLAAARAEAARDAAAIKEAARREGYADGRRAALAEAAAEAESIRQKARAVLEQAREIRREMLTSLEGEMVGLAREMAERIVAAQLTLDPAAVLSIAREALETARAREDVLLLVNPADAEVVHRHRAELEHALPPGAVLQVIADEAVAAGGCLVEAGDGRVEASLVARWRALDRALYGAADDFAAGVSGAEQ